MTSRSFTKNKGPGRKPKFKPGQVAYVPDEGYVVVVDYTQDDLGRGRYRYIRLLSLKPFRRVGPPKWLPSHLIKRIVSKMAPYSVKVYKANNLLVERGCTCMCCVHTALDVSDVNLDGTLAWENEHGA